MSSPTTIVVSTPTTAYSAVGAASAQLNLPMVKGQLYEFLASGACFIAQGDNPTAAAANGSRWVNAGDRVILSGDFGAKLAVIQDAAGSKCTLGRVYVHRPA